MSFRDVPRTLSNIYDGDFCKKKLNGFYPLTIFVKQAPSQILDRVLDKSLSFTFDVLVDIIELIQDSSPTFVFRLCALSSGVKDLTKIKG